MRIRTRLFGVIASAALLTSAGGAVVATVASVAPTGVSAATAIEYGTIHGPTAVE